VLNHNWLRLWWSRFHRETYDVQASQARYLCLFTSNTNKLVLTLDLTIVGVYRTIWTNYFKFLGFLRLHKLKRKFLSVYALFDLSDRQGFRSLYRQGFERRWRRVPAHKESLRSFGSRTLSHCRIWIIMLDSHSKSRVSLIIFMVFRSL